MHSKRQKLEEIAERFAEKEVKQGLRPGGEAALAYHRAQGHRIVIASAAVDLIVEAIARKLNIADFICTKLAWTDAGVLLEDFASPNCYGQAKLDCVKDWLDTNVEGEKTIYFYSDSNADLPVLDYVDYPVVIDPSAKFSKVAMARKIPVQNWRDLKSGFIPIEVKT